MTLLSGGDTVYEDGGYRYHVFLASGDITVSSPGDVEYLVVAGGSGGGSNIGGGGGAGGVLTGTTTLSASPVAVIVGDGGLGPTTNTGNGRAGGLSSLGDAIVALAGGVGQGGTQGGSGGNGGSGGGSGIRGRLGGSGTPGQGNDGGDNQQSTGQAAGTSSGSGGGGAGGPGANVPPGDATQAAAGGIGIQWLDGNWYGGGGAGGRGTSITGGVGGQGGGGNSGASGTANTGGGGGGGAGGFGFGAPGGSGIVIVRYPFGGELVWTLTPVDLVLGLGVNELRPEVITYQVDPIDLILDLGSNAIGYPLEIQVDPIDLILDLGSNAWEQTVYQVDPIDLILGFGFSFVYWPVIVAAPDVLHLSGAVATPRLPPIVPPGQPVPVDVELRRGETGELLGRFRSANVESCSWTMNGIGEAMLTWVPRADAEPEVIPHLIADGQPRTWYDDDLEVWIYRAGRLVWVGPIVWQRHDPRTGRLHTRAWSREGYLKKMTYGRAGRTNHFAVGYFTPGLPGWSGVDAAIAASTAVVYRRPHSMQIGASGGRPRAAATFTSGPDTRVNIFHFLLVARFESGAGWAEDPDTRQPVAGRVTRTLIDPGTGDVVRSDVWPILVDTSSGYGAGQWLRATRPVRREAGYINSYRVEVHGIPGAVVYVGEIEAILRQNIGAYAGDGRRYSAWVAALGDATCQYLAGDDWTYDVGPAGPILVSSFGVYAEDHPQFWSLWEDASLYGDFWCPVQPGRVIRYRARRGRYRPELRVVGQQMANTISTEWDAADDAVANEMVVLSDGADGPTREEGGASVPTTGARLYRCEMAPPGTLPRDLDLQAQTVLVTEARPRRRASLTPAAGPAQAEDPARRSVPGAIIHVVEPGDWTTMRQVDGALDYTVDMTVETMRWDARADHVSVDWLTT